MPKLNGGKKNVYKNEKVMEENPNKNRTLVDERGCIKMKIKEIWKKILVKIELWWMREDA